MRACLNLLCMLLLLYMFHVLIPSYRVSCVFGAVAAMLQKWLPLPLVHHPLTAELSRNKLLV